MVVFLNFIIYHVPRSGRLFHLYLVPDPQESIQPELFLVATIAQFPFIEILQNGLLCVG